MRLIGELPDKRQAERFRLFLSHRDIESEVRSDEGACEVWILREDDVESASRWLEEFSSDPANPKYQGVARDAKKIIREREKKEKRRPLVADGRLALFQAGQTQVSPITTLLLMASVIATLVSRFGALSGPLSKLFITANGLKPLFPEIAHGEIWRLVTPIFLHFDLLHLLFNMMWLFDLGNQIESRKGSLFFLGFVTSCTLFANLSQYFVSGPRFGGMSGVVYGLVGYVWMKGKYDPGSRLGLHPTTVVTMLLWYFLCFFSIAPIGNAAHTAGLVFGVTVGFFTSARREPLQLLWRNRRSRIFLSLFLLFLSGQIAYHILFSNIVIRERLAEKNNPCYLISRYRQTGADSIPPAQKSDFSRGRVANAGNTSLCCYRYCLFPDDDVELATPELHPGWFLARLWALWGEPEPLEGEYAYALTEKKSGLTFVVRTEMATPAYYCRPGDRQAIVPLVERFDALLRRTAPLRNCSYFMERVNLRVGTQNGRPFPESSE